jgi:hypothetical protein
LEIPILHFQPKTSKSNKIKKTQVTIYQRAPLPTYILLEFYLYKKWQCLM